ncbi:MAG TPA: PP2C family serine/threonine-protein phosphatase [Acidimicrobiales bacterium]|nr:PP2C family serine/threonine-protein phosphatase [Acidimicrobiales bacterium]
MSTDTQPDAEVIPCRVCASPVFDDELFCEACGTPVAGESPPAPAAVPSQAAGRQERDLGVIAAVTDRGKRRHRNEDAMAIAAVNDRFVAVVCDGVASTANPHLAARAAADATLAVLEPLLHAPRWPEAAPLGDLLAEAFAEAQAAVTLVSDDEPDGNDLSPSTTLVAAVVTTDGIVVGSVGDSRAYWLSPTTGHSRTLTMDDSWAQDSIAEGVAPEVAYAHPEAHTITRWIGSDTDSAEPAVVAAGVSEPGLLVLCTDGLWNYFEDAERLAALIPFGAATPIDTARMLTDAALAAGGQDNITVAVIPVDPTLAPSVAGPEEGELHRG